MSKPLPYLTQYDLERIERRRCRRDHVPSKARAAPSPPVPRPRFLTDEPRLIVPPLDRKAVYQSLSVIRLWRAPWRPACGPRGSGVYFLFVGFDLTYIGQSKDVSNRLRAHRMNVFDRRSRVIPYDLWAAIEVPEWWLDEVEREYIGEHQPPFNIRGIRP